MIIDKIFDNICCNIHPTELKDKLARKTSLRIKFGIDPTGDDIHLGHCVVLERLAYLQKLGHKIILIVGNFTALIGDPTGKNKMRPPLTAEQIQANCKSYQAQFFKILDPAETSVVYNNSWFSKLTSSYWLSLLAKNTVAQLMQRQDFKIRQSKEVAIGVHELIYPVLQGYDSVQVNSDVEFGGTDQLFNLMLARQLQTQYNQEPQCVITCNLIPGLDGSKKMSKSSGNYISLDDSQMFAKLMSIDDDTFWIYAEALLVDLGAHKPKNQLTGKEVMQLKKDMAFKVVERYQGEIEANKQQAEFFHEVTPSITYNIKVPHCELDGLQLLKLLSLPYSNSELKRLVEQKAVKCNNTVLSKASTFNITDVPQLLSISLGRKTYIQINISKE